jgi:hypothetical protein
MRLYEEIIMDYAHKKENIFRHFHARRSAVKGENCTL